MERRPGSWRSPAVGRHAVEEDVYGLLQAHGCRPWSPWPPERVLYLTGCPRPVAPGLRLATWYSPPGLRGRMREDEHHTTWYVSALTMALATRWLTDGTACGACSGSGPNWPRGTACGQDTSRPSNGAARPTAPMCGWRRRRRVRSLRQTRFGRRRVVVPSSVLAAGASTRRTGAHLHRRAPDRKTLAEACQGLRVWPSRQQKPRNVIAGL